MQDVGYRMLDTGWMIVEFSLCSLRLTPCALCLCQMQDGWCRKQDNKQQTTS